jgi:branched-chain amino acid transport system substrate-binding protein
MSSLADLPELIGFFSYSRDDDESYRGRLSALREAIQHELSAQLGRSRKNFRLWQDHEAIAPGRLWEAEIKAAVEQAVFFIPIVTPRGVNSQHCQFEFESFLARERALGRTDLVFPILYVPVPALENEAQWRDHPVLSVIGKRQYVDWQTFRYADAPTPAMREEIARFARKIVEALTRPSLSPEERQRQEEAAAQGRAENERRQQQAERQRQGQEDARRRNEESQAQRLAEKRLEQDADEERAVTSAAAAGAAPAAGDAMATHREPTSPWRPSRRAMLIGGGAAGVGAIGGAAVMMSRGSGPDINPPAAVANAPALVEHPPVAPALVTTRASEAVRIGLSNPLSGNLMEMGANQFSGCQVALDQLNARNGILGRPIELISYDSTSTNPQTAAANASKLIEIDKVDVLVGNLISLAALAMIGLSSQRGILQIVTGAHADEITGAQCKWNVFRFGSTTSMQANAVCPAMLNAHGKAWQFITSDYPVTRTAYQSYDATLKRLGGRNLGNVVVPLGAADFSPYLIKVQAAKPDVLALLIPGPDLANCLRQASGIGIDKRLHLGGGQLDLETITALPPQARVGSYMLEWYWKQAVGTPGLDQFVAAARARTGKVPTAQTWFGYAAIHAYALACEAAKTTDSKAVARALTDMPLPLDIRMQPNSAFIRGRRSPAPRVGLPRRAYAARRWRPGKSLQGCQHRLWRDDCAPGGGNRLRDAAAGLIAALLLRRRIAAASSDPGWCGAAGGGRADQLACWLDASGPERCGGEVREKDADKGHAQHNFGAVRDADEVRAGEHGLLRSGVTSTRASCPELRRAPVICVTAKNGWVGTRIMPPVGQASRSATARSRPRSLAGSPPAPALPAWPGRTDRTAIARPLRVHPLRRSGRNNRPGRRRLPGSRSGSRPDRPSPGQGSPRSAAPSLRTGSEIS